MGMMRYVVKRLSFLLPIIIVLLSLLFILSRSVPGDPVGLIAGKYAGEAERARIRAEYGFDKPLPIQFVMYLSRVLKGDLGTSIRTKRLVLDDILRRLPASLELIITGFLISSLGGVLLGTFSAIKKDSILDYGSRLFSFTGIAIPSFWLAILLQMILTYHFKILPTGGRIDIFLRPDHITGFLILDSIINLRIDSLVSSLSHLILPACLLAYSQIGSVTRMTRNEMLEVLGKEYIRTHRSYGIRDGIIYYKYALRNAFIPVLTRLGISFSLTFVGTVVIETVFDYPGMGLYMTNAILYQDFPAILGCAIFMSFIVLFVNLAVDLLYVYLDPRVRLERSES